MLSLISLQLLIVAIIAEGILALLWMLGLSEQEAMIQVLRRVCIDSAVAMFLLVFLLRQPRPRRTRQGPRLFPHSLKAYLES
jgi:hypothetical protein